MSQYTTFSKSQTLTDVSPWWPRW